MMIHDYYHPHDNTDKRAPQNMSHLFLSPPTSGCISHKWLFQGYGVAWNTSMNMADLWTRSIHGSRTSIRVPPVFHGISTIVSSIMFCYLYEVCSSSTSFSTPDPPGTTRDSLPGRDRRRPRRTRDPILRRRRHGCRCPRRLWLPRPRPSGRSPPPWW